MIFQSCPNICEQENDSDLVKSCFSNDDILILKEHPEYDVTAKGVLDGDLLFSPFLHDEFCVFYNEYRSTRRIGIRNGFDSSNQSSGNSEMASSEKILEKGRIINNDERSQKVSNGIKSTKYQYVPEYEKKIKECKNLRIKLSGIEREIKIKVEELKNLEGLLQSDINYLHLKKLQIIESINLKVQRLTEKVIDMNKKKQKINQRTEELNRLISEIQEIIKRKETTNAEYFFKLYQSGRLAFEFNKKLEIASSIDIRSSSHTQYDKKYLEQVLQDITVLTTQLKIRMAQESYTSKKEKQAVKMDSYIIKITKDCLLYLLTSKTREAKRVMLRAIINTLGYEDSIKEKLIKKMTL